MRGGPAGTEIENDGAHEAGIERLRVALAIFRLAPAGGREQQCLALAAELSRRGHEVAIVATGSAGEPRPPGVERIPLSRRGRSSHGRLAAFAADAGRATEGRFDRTVAFHLIPGFDFLFCCDPPRGPARGARAWSPRYRTFARLEAAVFAPTSRSVALALAQPQLDALKQFWGLAEARGVLLPPAVDRARLDPAAVARAPNEGSPVVWLWSGLAPRTKGLDRVLAALAAAPETRLVVVGLAQTDAKAREPLALARRLGVADRTQWAGFLAGDALKAAVAGADLLIHPARADVTGNVIVEALINGLPVIATEACGFAGHVRLADAGRVLPEPFRQADLDRALADAGPATRAAWSRNALAYGRTADLFDGVARAADLIERGFR